MTRPTCATCPYWDQMPRSDLKHEAQGYCRRNAPVVIATGEHGSLYPQTEHPWTNASLWCGEHPAMPAWLAAAKDA